MPDAHEKNDSTSDLVDAKIVDAEIVPAVLVHDASSHVTEGPTGVALDLLTLTPSRFDTDVNLLSAKGGAVGGLLLGLLGLAGMTFSLYSLFNVLLALAFSIWGLRSPRRKTAIAGLLIGLVGLLAFFLKLES